MVPPPFAEAAFIAFSMELVARAELSFLAPSCNHCKNPGHEMLVQGISGIKKKATLDPSIITVCFPHAES